MEYRQLGRTNLQVSSIGMGCVTFGREIDRQTSFAVLDRAFERGITLYDTAEAYSSGGSETVLGAWISDRGVRERIVLATKVTNPLGRARIFQSVDDSLRRLKTDLIDLFQLHTWDPDTPLDETLSALTTLVQRGKVRYVGCSNWFAWQLAKSLLMAQPEGFVRFESVQLPYNLVQREIEPEIAPLCADQGIGVIAYSPLGAGFLTGKYRPGEAVPKGTRFDVIPGHQPLYFTPTGFRVLEQLRATAEQLGTSMVHLALAWVLGRPGVTTVLIGARSVEHIDQALAAQSIELSSDVRDTVGKLGIPAVID